MSGHPNNGAPDPPETVALHLLEAASGLEEAWRYVTDPRRVGLGVLQALDGTAAAETFLGAVGPCVLGLREMAREVAPGVLRRAEDLGGIPTAHGPDGPAAPTAFAIKTGAAPIGAVVVDLSSPQGRVRELATGDPTENIVFLDIASPEGRECVAAALDAVAVLVEPAAIEGWTPEQALLAVQWAWRAAGAGAPADVPPRPVFLPAPLTFPTGKGLAR